MARLIVLFVTAFVDMIGAVMILPLLPFYATHLGANAFVYGALISAFSVAQLAVAPVWGRFSDRYGRRPMILAGLGLTAVAYIVFAYAHSLPLLLLSRIVQGIGGGTIGVVQAYVVDASPAEDRTKNLGWLSAVTSLGAVVGPAFGPLLLDAWGMAAPGLAAAALATLTAAFAWRFLRESKGMRPSGSYAAGTPPAHATGLAAVWRVVTHWHEPAARLIWIYAIAIGAFYGTGLTFPLLLTERLHADAKTVGYVFMYFGGMGVVVRSLILGRMVDWLGEARLARLGVTLLAVGLGLGGLFQGWATLGVAITLMPLGTAFLFPCVTGQLSRVISGRERGLWLGLQHTYGGLSRITFPLVAGALMDHFDKGVPFVISGAMVLLTFPLTSVMQTGRPAA